MSPKVWSLLERPHEDLVVAGELLQGSHPEHAASASYYAMFHAAEAFLVSIGIEVSSHGATHAAFGLHFARTRQVDPKLHRYLLDAFDKRLTADYDVAVKLTPEEARTLFDQAHEFVAAAEAHLNTAAYGA